MIAEYRIQNSGARMLKAWLRKPFDLLFFLLSRVYLRSSAVNEFEKTKPICRGIKLA